MLLKFGIEILQMDLIARLSYHVNFYHFLAHSNT